MQRLTILASVTNSGPICFWPFGSLPNARNAASICAASRVPTGSPLSPSSGIAVAVIELKNSYVSIGNGIRTFPEGELAAAYRGSRTNCHRRGCWANAVEENAKSVMTILPSIAISLGKNTTNGCCLVVQIKPRRTKAAGSGAASLRQGGHALKLQH